MTGAAQQVHEFVWKPGRNGSIEFCSNFKRLQEKEPKTAALLLGHFGEEGFQTEDSAFTYKIYHSTYGYSVGRRKKPVVIPVEEPLQQTQSVPIPLPLSKTSQSDNSVTDHTNEIMKILHDLTYAMNSLVLATLATSEAERNIVKARLSRSE